MKMCNTNYRHLNFKPMRSMMNASLANSLFGRIDSHYIHITDRHITDRLQESLIKLCSITMLIGFAAIVLAFFILPVSAGTNVSFLAVDLDVPDIVFSSSDYVEGIRINVTTTESNKNYTLISTMNILKLSGGGTNEVWVRVCVDDEVKLEEKLRTVSRLGKMLDEGSSGTKPVMYNVLSGAHNLTYEFKRTGNGAIEINDIDIGVMQFVTTAGNPTRAQITSVDITHSSADPVEIFRWNADKTSASDTFIIGKYTLVANDTIYLQYYYKNLESQLTSPHWRRYMPDASNVGSVSGLYIDTDTNTSINQSIFSKITADASVTATVNGTILDFDLNESANDLINHFQTSNQSTNITNSINLTAGTHLLARQTVTNYNGTGYFLGMTSSFKSKSDVQTPVYFINSSDLLGCYSKKERFLRSNDDIGNAFIYYVYNGTEIGQSYTFDLWVTVADGEELEQFDESFVGFEISAFPVEEVNVAPIVAIITPDPFAYLSGSFYINASVTDTNEDPFTSNVTLSNQSDTIYIGTNMVRTNMVQTNLSILFDSTTVSDGEYTITWNSTENESTDLYSANNAINVTIDNTVPAITLDAPTSASRAYRSGGQELYVNFTYVEVNPKNYTILIQNATHIINSSSATTTDSPVNVSFMMNSTAADGDYNVTVTVWDNASNTHSVTEESAVVMDSIPPTAPTGPSHTDDAPAGYDNDNSIDISWTGSIDVSPVTYRIYRDGVLNDTTPSLNYKFTNENEGAHTYNVSAGDVVGNINSTNASITLTVDLTPPVIHNVSLSDLSPAYGQPITVSVNVTDVVTNVTSVFAGSTPLTHRSGALWNGSIEAGYGTNTVTVTAYDNASNRATNSSVAYTGPSAPIDDSNGGVHRPPALPENVIYREVKGTTFSEPVASADLTFTKGYITLVTVDAKDTISEVMVTIQQLAGRPSEITVAPPSGAVHSYHDIELGRIGNDDLAGATIKFRAEKKWVVENGGDRNAVVVMRYHDDWMALETKPIGEDDEYVFFSARTPGFSTFAITMELEEEEEVAPVEVDTPEPVVEEVVDDPLPEPEPQEEKSYWWLILVIAAIVVVGVVFFVYKNRKDESEK